MSNNNKDKQWWITLKSKELKQRLVAKLVAIKKAVHFYLCRLSWRFIQTSEDKLPETTTSLPDLCPTSYAVGIEAYEERLTDLLLNHKKVTEIALTSPYSGGKSSLIDTYMRKHPHHKYTNISLADFKVVSDEPDENGQLQLIEKSIVQQILYRVKDSEMPNSRFRKIVMRKPSWHWLLAQPLGLLILSFSAAIVIFPTSNITTSFNILLDEYTPSLSTYAFQFCLLFLFTFPFLILKDTLKLLNKFSISKLNLIKGEVTLDSKNNDSIFNLHIEEIVYYFSATKSNVVIFEDLDRFDKPEIFIKLKEINKLINDSNEVGQRVCFIYALKDDVFKGNNRTKFFDAIIPIVPITNSVNSYPRLKTLLEDSNLLNGLKDEFLRDVAVFIQDMRMLKNIVTEYAIYKKTLSSSLEEPEFFRLFSFIIYKNIYCADFANLQENKGVLADFFKNKRKLQQTLATNIQKKIEIIKNEIKAIEDEELRSIEEINAVFIIALVNELPHDNAFLINGNSLSDFPANNVFQKAWESDSVINYNTVNYNRALNANQLSDYNNIITPSYSQRKQYLEDKKNNATASLNQKISALKVKSKHSQNSSVKELTKLVSKEELYSHLLVDEDSEKPSQKIDYTLLVHLIEKGYINEMYDVYISHFLEGNVTKADMSFVLKVKSNQPIDSEFPLIKTKEIVEYLNSDDYSNDAAFNYDLINYLIDENEPEHLKTIVSMVKDDSSALDVKEVLESLKYINNKKAWLTEVVSEWQSIWVDIINTDSLNILEKNDFIIELITELYGVFDNTHLPINDEYKVAVRQHINEISYLSILISENSDNYTNGIDALKFLEIQLKGFDTDEINGQFITDIINNDLFLPTLDNYKHLASIITSQAYDDIDMSLSAFQAFEDDSLSNQIDGDINYFVSNVLLNEGFTIGTEDSCLYLLNHNHLSGDLKELLIEDEDFEITSIGDIPNRELWPQILKSKKLLVSWQNVSSLLEENSKFLAASIDFLCSEDVYTILTSKEERENCHLIDKQIESFINILASSNFDLTAFSQYSPLFKDSLLAFPLSDLPNEQVDVLIEQQYIEFTEENYSDIEDHHPSSMTIFLESKFSQVIKSEIYSSLTFTAEDMETFLSSDLLSKEEKASVSVKLDEDEENISNILFNLYFGIINSAQIQLPEHLLRVLVTFKLGELPKKVTLLTSQIAIISKELTFELLTSFGYPYNKIATTKAQCRLEKSKGNQSLAEALVQEGYFSMSKSNEYSETIRINKIGK